MTLLQDLVSRAAARRPTATAVRGPDGVLTYRELDETANRIARALQALGVGQGDRVALWGEKSSRLVAAIQAALRLGAAYVPLAAHTPSARAATMLGDCNITCVVTDSTRLVALGQSGPGRFAALLTDDWAGIAQESADPIAPPLVLESDLAYILYTSGSTGVPKGVCVSHANAVAFVSWAAETAHLRQNSQIANHAAFSFDLSVFDLYGAFHAGACVTIVPEPVALSPGRLVDFLAREAVHVLYSVPSALMLMMDHGGLLERRDLTLETVIFAGEVFPIRQLRRLRDAWPHVRLLNFYGPTETNVCAWFEVGAIDPAATAAAPIGRPSCGDRLWLGDADGRPVRGDEGQLFVEGPTVMLGYWGQEPQGQRPYATGDACRIDADGNFVYVGRVDQQVKIRGARVELGEVEAVLAGCPGVAEVAVVVQGDGPEARLVAFFVSNRTPPPPLIELKAHCARQLPPYMIVSLAWPIAEMPLTPNGKVDRRRLVEFASDAGAMHATG
jgi:amino acid adenylation domain-containing protein